MVSPQSAYINIYVGHVCPQFYPPSTTSVLHRPLYAIKFSFRRELGRIHMAEYPQNPDLQYYPPPRAWLSPPASWVETPPTWIDPPSSSSSDHVPLWVILGLVAAILILLLFIFMYIKKRFKSNSHCRASPAVEKTVAALPPPPVVEKIVAAPPQHGHHHNCEGHLAAGMPKDCPSCGRSAGLYQLTYRCPKCIYKQDIGIHIDYPNKK